MEHESGRVAICAKRGPGLHAQLAANGGLGQGKTENPKRGKVRQSSPGPMDRRCQVRTPPPARCAAGIQNRKHFATGKPDMGIYAVKTSMHDEYRGQNATIVSSWTCKHIFCFVRPSLWRRSTALPTTTSMGSPHSAATIHAVKRIGSRPFC